MGRTPTPAQRADPRSTRRLVRAAPGRGMAVASQPLATAAAVEMLGAGGTAADAAVAAAATLCVVDPGATGMGGDAFALYWPAGAPAPIGLDGAGPSAAAASVEALRAAGHDAMPTAGPWTITVPGAVDAWSRLLQRFGRLGLERVLQPAIGHAGDGFAVTPVVAAERAGGPLRAADLAEWAGARWVAPLARSYRGTQVFELPPPGQGIVALAAIGIFEGLSAADPAEEEHHAIEALKLAF